MHRMHTKLVESALGKMWWDDLMGQQKTLGYNHEAGWQVASVHIVDDWSAVIGEAEEAFFQHVVFQIKDCPSLEHSQESVYSLQQTQHVDCKSYSSNTISPNQNKQRNEKTSLNSQPTRLALQFLPKVPNTSCPKVHHYSFQVPATLQHKFSRLLE